MPEETKRNFLVVEFGDNDFGYTIKSAIEELSSRWTDNIENYCPYAIKAFIIAHVVCYSWKKECLWLKEDSLCLDELTVLPDVRILNWLKDIRVTFRTKMPTYEPEGYPEHLIDHDGGSAAMNLHTKEVFTF